MAHPLPSFEDLARRLAAIVETPSPGNPAAPDARWATERLTLVAAILEAAFRRMGWHAVFVGGGVLQFHLGGNGYTTGDIDMVVAARSGQAIPRADLNTVFIALGCRPGSGRHWHIGTGLAELLVEVPSHEIPSITDTVTVAPDLVLTMDPVEHVIAGRIIEFHNTGNAEHALQAIHALRTLQAVLNESRLTAYVAAEGVDLAHRILLALRDRPGTITVALLAFAHDIEQARQPWCDLSSPQCGPSGPPSSP